ncbi:MAG: hypothetical protein LQ350_005473 [Teloschistes chrysophthalmus]|nr:MAG: hypothetical protein LQ350_005473 [Niorma chrysophthalma]
MDPSTNTRDIEDWTERLRALRREFEEGRISLLMLAMLLGQRITKIQIMVMTCDPEEKDHALQCGKAFMELWEKTSEWQQERYLRFREYRNSVP